MDTVFHVGGEPDALIEVIFPADDHGHLLFGFSGRSRVPSYRSRLFSGEVEISDYLMEGFVPYKVSVTRENDGLVILVRKTGTNRDECVDWFVEKYLSAKGLVVSKRPA
jgi:hypothetical protein